ncbi:MAG: molybdate ABC transporter substrate-binding protein [Alphaproteobacteria bacterium]|nr:molybdate ABC transporter substrate-binding protein [Alphaproteobacteria bacterium]MCW5741977.1 molybdate ABC transporter substrate-binding protein [Alphaproteobacteria bacterium]
MRHRGWRRCFTAILFVATSSSGVAAQEIRVLAAASLSSVLDRLCQTWAARGEPKCVPVYAASSALARQIENGAPGDVFISADEPWMKHVVDRKAVKLETRRALATNLLVIVASADSRVLLTPGTNFAIAAALDGGRLSLADPDTVPAGRYAKAALTHFGVWDQVAGRIARAENARDALAFVARGAAPLGIVYGTDARAEPKVRIVATFPEGSHPPVVYPMAVTANVRSPRAQAFLDFLTTPQSQKTLADSGFGPPPK